MINFNIKKREKILMLLKQKVFVLLSIGKKDSKVDIYKCGDLACGKFYHSYTAFYNHCKKSHGG
jgi:hypothetical protein